ncbi:MAG TPA: hypothetical protein DEB15_08060 [Pusillimonas sp.]|mgnify:CR=1 FL=1|jgi:hypothetical protein|nr:hypothetical protein [Pusillimonas sp.]MBC43282.1 hypothetical protein [Pusillimonas sp.]HBT32784.1 hypothetical protein [Pusillimonas sp.]HCN71399.1 hypothetical protein [Pusillimonas sp.]HCP78734.1 hypothetical protein [Pusillimonas sp.]|tara:strand:+ start:69591 stop:70040 length:450 start_codon:yes stop_codon:yes gene_type:complete
MAKIKVYVLVAENDVQAQADPLWQKLENDQAVLLSCSASLVNATGRAWHYRREISLNEYVCFCCKAQGPVLALLRDLFLQALHRKLAPFPVVVVHTTEALDAISLGRALELDPFLADRYEYIGTGEKIPSACVGVIEAAFAKAEKLDGN